MFSVEKWHQRFVQQASWTKELQQYLFDRAGLSPDQNILDLGYGTGAVESVSNLTVGITGVDLDIEKLDFAAQNNRKDKLCLADGLHLPFQKNTFDLAFCHYFFLWVKNPASILQEMCRTTKPDGHIMAIAEPDYGGRIDYPPELEKIGGLQTEALKDRGANPYFGRKLSGLFHQNNLLNIETGVINGVWQGYAGKQDWQLEWEVLMNDIPGSINEDELLRLKSKDKEARNAGRRVLYVPTFYAIGQVP